MNETRILRIFLRITGTFGLLALVAVFMPHTGMNRINDTFCLGPLPDLPIISYLARFTSIFYAFFGAGMWFFSFDVQKYRESLIFIGIASLVLTFLLLGVDLMVGMPWYWTLGETLGNGIIALVVLGLALRLNTAETEG